MLGYVHAIQPTVILRVSSSREVNAWICACQTTDRDLEIFNVVRKVNAWIRAKCLFYLKL